VKPLSISLYCEKLKKKAIVYCYPLPDGSVSFNGCEEINACAACSRCKVKAEQIASEELSALQRDDLLFNKP
jgi:hypothetical protein